MWLGSRCSDMRGRGQWVVSTICPIMESLIKKMLHLLRKVRGVGHFCVIGSLCGRRSVLSDIKPDVWRENCSWKDVSTIRNYVCISCMALPPLKEPLDSVSHKLLTHCCIILVNRKEYSSTKLYCKYHFIPAAPWSRINTVLTSAIWWLTCVGTVCVSVHVLNCIWLF